MMGLLQKTVTVSEGTVPFIISVSHDGALAHIDGQELPFSEKKNKNDAGTRKLAWMVKAVAREHVPSLIIENVERPRLVPDIKKYFYERVLSCVRLRLNEKGQCYLIDLHAFGEQTGFGSYDIIFGTNHRGTVLADFDVAFAEELNSEHNLRIYVPGDLPAPGERFGATKGSTLVNWLKKSEPSVDAIQVEVYKSWLSDSNQCVILAELMASAIASFFSK